MTVAAALIVRDAEADLKRCLASVVPNVDQIVVVDTGSIDGTLEVARSFNATVGHFDWIDDFAAARNAALGLAETDWILSIDADEEMRTNGQLRQLLDQAGQTVQFLVDITDARHGGLSRAGRLFKNTPGAHWELPLHETIVQPGFESVPWGHAGGALSLVHYGYETDVAGRIERNLRILRAHLSKEPDNSSSLFYLARECLYAELYQEGDKAAQHLIETADLEGERLADALCLAAWHATYLKRFEEAVELTREARRQGVANVWTEYARAFALVQTGSRGKAAEAIERACSLPYPENSLLTFQEIWTHQRFAFRAMLQQP